MSGKNINFDNKKIFKSDFYKNKKLIKIDYINVNKIFISKNEPFGTQNSLKYFIGYNYNGVIRPLCIKLPQMIGYFKHFDSNKAMSCKVIENKLLKNHAEVLERVSSLINIEFDSEPVYGNNAKYIKKNKVIER